MSERDTGGRSTSTGAGRRVADEAPLQFIKPGPRVPGTVLATRLRFEALPGEETVDDVLRNSVRRVGVPHDAAELVAGHPDASNCHLPAIGMVVGDPLAVAATKVVRAKGSLGELDEVVRMRMFEVSISQKAIDQAPLEESDEPGDAEPGLRLADRRDSENETLSGGLPAIHRAGRQPNSSLFAALDRIRTAENCVAILIPSPPDEPAPTLVVWRHRLAALEAAGLIEVTKYEVDVARDDLLARYPELAPGSSRLERQLQGIRTLNSTLRDFISEFEVTARLITRALRLIRRMFTVLGAVAAGGLVALFSDQLAEPVLNLAREIVKWIR